MKKTYLISILLVAILLTGCAPKASVVMPSVPTAAVSAPTAAPQPEAENKTADTNLPTPPVPGALIATVTLDKYGNVVFENPAEERWMNLTNATVSQVADGFKVTDIFTGDKANGNVVNLDCVEDLSGTMPDPSFNLEAGAHIFYCYMPIQLPDTEK